MKNLVIATALSFVGLTAIANENTPELKMDEATVIVAQDFEEINVSDLPTVYADSEGNWIEL